MVRHVSPQRSNTKIFFRILPMLKTCWEHLKILENQKTIYLRCLQDFEKGRDHLEPTYWKFETDGVFYNSTQELIYESVTNELLNKIVEGNNGMILSYGQTGSGKTVTTSGLENSYEDRGIVPRVIDDILKIKERYRGKMCVKISYVELSRSFGLDLLRDDDILLDMITIKNVSAVKVNNLQAALSLIFKAEARKTVIRNKFYSSNKSNTVITFIITTKASTLTDLTIGKLHVVDLSGCDTVGNISCLHKNGFEIGTGNLAKTQLEQFLLILTEGKMERSLVKQRMCLIVNYLKDTLNTTSLLRFIGHIQMPIECLMVTISMLRFGQLARGLRPKKLKPNIFRDVDTKINILEEQLARMKRDSDLNAIIHNQDLTTNLSNDRLLYITKLAQDYLQNKNGEIALLHTNDAVLALKLFKNLYNNLEIEKNTYADQLRGLDDTHGSKNALLKCKEGSSHSTRQSRKNLKHSVKSNQSGTSMQIKGSKKPVLSKRSSNNRGLRDSKKDSVSVFEKPPKTQRQSNSKITRRNSTSKRRSSISTDLITNTDTLTEDGKSKIPEEVPEFPNAWDLFVDDLEYKYIDLNDDLMGCEKTILECNLKYIKEVKKLQEINEFVEIRKEELCKAEFLRDLDSIPKEGDSMTELEFKCHENLKQVEAKVVVKKEEILKLQTDLKLAIDSAKYVRSTIDKQFANFCKTKYKTLVPNLESVHTESSQDSSQDVEQEIAAKSINNPEEEKSLQFEQLKKMMRLEHEKRFKNKIRDKRWIQSLKT